MEISRNKSINDIFQFRKWPNSRFEDSLSCNICWFSLPVENYWLMSVHNVFVLKKTRQIALLLGYVCTFIYQFLKQPPGTLFAPGVPKISYYCEGRKHCLTRDLSWWYIMCTYFSCITTWKVLLVVCIPHFQFFAFLSFSFDHAVTVCINNCLRCSPGFRVFAQYRQRRFSLTARAEERGSRGEDCQAKTSV